MGRLALARRLRRGLRTTFPLALLATALLIAWVPPAGATHGGCHQPEDAAPEPNPQPRPIRLPPQVVNTNPPIEETVPDPEEADDSLPSPVKEPGTEQTICSDQNDSWADPENVSEWLPKQEPGSDPGAADATENASIPPPEPTAPTEETPPAVPPSPPSTWVMDPSAEAPPEEAPCACPAIAEPVPQIAAPPAAASPTAQGSVLASAAPAAATAVMGGLLLWRLAALLLARRGRPEERLHPRAKALLDAVCAQPGLSLRGLRAAAGLANGVALHHLAGLLRLGLVVAHRHQNTVRFFENHGRYAAAWRQAAVLRDVANRRLLGWLAANPGACQRDLVAGSAAWGWRRGVTQKRLALLAEAGLIVGRREGRAVRYEALPPAQALPDDLRAWPDATAAPPPATLGPAGRVGPAGPSGAP